uniref:CapA n=1 Tax=Capnodium sp. TTI-000886 TaxID=3078996 RepID=A0AA96MMU9_9PEZI|nr:CapA [Capnodium sp. TTI-000886]
MYQNSEPIAVVGSSCRFPGGASSPSKLWDLLHEPRDVLREFDQDRLNLKAFHHDNGEHHGRTNVCNKAYLIEEDTRRFDARFFNITPAEAEAMDPQQRLTLETVYESFEAAGYTLQRVQGSLTSVYLGVMTGDYHDIQVRDPETINRYHATGTATSILSNRVSYYFDLRGPSMTLDTACSSSLAALHLAVQSLRQGESSMAIAAGVNLIFDPTGYISESKMHMLSPTSRSRMWDAGADGYARGEGVAAVVLKPLSHAIRDGDHIECIVRETGMNSDGRTPGITMPSADAQATLIQRTYRAAGLDPFTERPQFFECHGTGTLAGDPVEARAVRNSFFSATGETNNNSRTGEKLYCGSIKTVIGHTEGCAGLAGLLKASLALQNAIIPPNLLFSRLNPAIEPLYDHLQVPTAAVPWPYVNGNSRRVSINSFGFGGTNVHAILENYMPKISIPKQIDSAAVDHSVEHPRFVGPLLLSSETESSLATTIQNFLDFFRANPGIDLEDVAFTTQTRRTIFPTRAFFSGSSPEKLLKFLDTAIQNSNAGADVGIRNTNSISASDPPAILGIFTGQGAQWASMGRMLIDASYEYRNAIERCEKALQGISDAPTWSLMAELLAPEEESRINEAAISQPLCTATQIAMLDLLAAANIRCDAVVGHSSGEIAAAYAAGILSATDAMRIAYYRGFHAKLACGSNGQRGAMMAVGLGYDDAIAFCSRFEGRVGLAASNSPNSTTLSGDEDAILEAKEILEDEKTFARLLKVDTAYHSHHMAPCAEPYLKSMKQCSIKVNPPSEKCTWISSVYGTAEILEDEEELGALAGPYWVANMVKPVLFSEAIECSLWRAGPFNLAAEIGPHPALKGPASQTMKTALGSILPFATLMRRGYDDVEAFSGGLGYIWAYLGDFVDFAGFRKAIHGPDTVTPQIMKGLPSYSWDHKRVYWKESRPSRRYRLADKAPHELLGRRMGDDADSDLRWRNILKLNELPWLRGHAFQGQALFPTSAYMAMAIQAAIEIAGDRPIKLIEIQDLVIPRGLPLSEDHPGVESIFTVKKFDNVETNQNVFQGDFTCLTCSSDATGVLEKRAGGVLSIFFGTPSLEVLPSRAPGKSGLTSVGTKEYYESLLSIGLDYQGVFRGIISVQRTMGYGTTKASWKRSDIGDQYVMHPGPLDVAFHSIIAALCSPMSGALWAPYLPVKVGRLSVIPNMTYEAVPGEIDFEVDAFITKTARSTFEGDVHIMDSSGRTGLQAEGLLFKRVTEAHPSDDRPVFSRTIWKVDSLSSPKNLEELALDVGDVALAEAIERTSLYVIKSIFDHLTDSDVEEWTWFHRAFYSAAKKALQAVRDNKYPTAKKAWLDDSRDIIMEYKQKYTKQADIELIHAVAENLVGVMTSDTQLLEVMLENDMLTNFYTDGRSFNPLNQVIGDLMQNLVHRYPHVKILEIGAGTGGTTSFVLSKIGDAYSHYTYTDVSAGFFENAKNRFAAQKGLTYKVLDIERDPLEQGFTGGSQDVILAANVLHATHNLNETLTNARKLLKPGGYLIMMEYTGESLEMMLLMGGLPGWWLGVDEGRARGPGISLTEWDKKLRDAGFAGCDKYVTDLPDLSKHSCSVIVSQAIDERTTMLQEPLSFLDEIPLEDRLLIIGGKTLAISRMIKSIEKLASRFTDRIMTANSIDDLQDAHFTATTSVICLADLEHPVFTESVSAERLQHLQALFSHATNVLWVTSGRLDEDPYSNMSVGLGRALITELPQLNLQFLDIDRSSLSLDGRMIVEMFLKLKLPRSADFIESPILWTTEPEIMLRDELLYIPRVLEDKERNARLNALRRTIVKEVSLDHTIVKITNNEGALALEEVAPWLKTLTPVSPGAVTLLVQHSISLPYAGSHQQYLSTGRLEGSGKTAMVISSYRCSHVTVPANHALIWDEDNSVDVNALRSTATHLAALLIKSVLSTAVPDAGSVLIYEPSEDLVGALSQVSIRPKLVFASSDDDCNPGFVRIHPRASARSIQYLLPRNVGYVIDLSSHTEHNVVQNLFSLFPGTKFNTDSANVEGVEELLHIAYDVAQASVLDSSTADPIITVQDLPSLGLSAALYPNVVDWSQHEQPVKTVVRPIDGSGLFSAEKTYVMVGLVSDLGRSICRWMIENGAKHIVLASRSGTVDAVWLDEVKALGATIHIYQMDVSIRASVQAAYDQIKQTCPPIGGVCNGALVLKDQLFVEMKEDALNDVFAPKVDGTVHLDEIFSDASLDFFILFSSISSVVGNAGQSNYNSASLFQAAIANRRRNNGLAASVVSLGMVVDVGYVAQRGPDFLAKLNTEFYLLLSEADVHLIFAEGVAASKPGASDDTVEMVSGIRPFKYNSSTKKRPAWFANPRLSHYVREEEAEESSGASRGNASSLQVRAQMDAAKSEEEAAAALLSAFANKLESMLQMSPGSLNAESSLLEVGIDSLLAVEIRTWFLKEVHVDIPVLKSLGGDNARDICADATKQYLSAKMRNNEKATLRDLQEAKAQPEESNSGSGTAPSEAPNSSLDSNDGRSVTPTNEGVATPETSMDGSASESESVSPKEMGRATKMSSAQSRLWFLHQLSKDPTFYNSLSTYQVKGYIQIPRLKRAVAAVVSHHDSLHTCFYPRSTNGEPFQALLKTPPDCFKHVQSDNENRLDSEIDSLKTRRWRITEGNGLQVVLVSHSPEDHHLLIGYHHIVMDGVGLHFFLRDLNAAYMGRALKKQPMQYMDLAIQERHLIEQGALDQKIDFWLKELSPLPEVLPLLPFSLVKARPATDCYTNNEGLRNIGPTLTGEIKNASQALRVTPFHFYTAAIQLLFNRLLQINDICIGVTDANRQEAGADVVGFFLNMLPLRFDLENVDSYADLVHQTSRKYHTAQRHSGVPFDMILDKAKVQHDMAHTPLFQIAMNYRQGNFSKLSLGSCQMDCQSVFESKSPYDIVFCITPAEDTCYVQIITRADLYSSESTERLVDMYTALLTDASKDVSKALSLYNIHDSSSVDEAISLGRASRVDFGWPLTLTERVDAVIRQFPDHIAYKDNKTSLTYAQLSDQVDRIALRILEAQQTETNPRVAVLCEPSNAWVVSMLAVIRTGGIYIPLDTTLPDERLTAILEASDASLMICHDTTLSRARKISNGLNVINIDDQTTSPVSTQRSVNMERPGQPTFILFTSGSTGKPKGIVLSQAGIINYLAGKANKLSLTQEVVLQQSALGFDMALAQAFHALSHGGTLIIVPQDSRGDPVALGKLMVENRVTFTLGTPTEYLMLLRYGGQPLRQQSWWRNACSGGEAVTSDLKHAFRSLQTTPPTVTDCYGPTEISCCATMQTVDLHKESDSPAHDGGLVGVANSNTSIYITDQNGNPLPTGMPGEIVIGGVGVALGYLDSNLTEQKFVSNPFDDFGNAPPGWNNMMYRTGDRGLLRSDGTLRFMGRLDGDTTVKIRGLRVDLEDIASNMLRASNGSVSDAVVTVRGDPAFLVAHVVLSENSSLDEKSLATFSSTLPIARYMRPSVVVALPRLPMSTNGKVDRKTISSLPLPDDTATQSGPTIKSMTLNEGELKILWMSVLKHIGTGSRLDTDSDFFMVGGTSLLLIKLQSAIRSSMGIELSLRDMYHASSLGEMAALIKDEKSNSRSQKIDWDFETALPRSPDFTVGQQVPYRKPSEPIEVLLTGSTGFVGGAVLSSLLESPAIRRVHCVAVDPDLESSHLKDDRVKIYSGSLSEPNLGLDDDTFGHLQGTVDRIILAGAQGHCLNNYASLRAPNVRSTRQISMFALRRRIPIHYISSSRTTLLNPGANAALPPVSVAEHKPATDGSDGFTAAKWASEVFLEKLCQAANEHSDSPLPVTIHRLCAVVGQDAPLEDALNALLRYSNVIRAVPRVSSLNVQGYFDFRDVHEVADEIVGTVVNSDSGSDGLGQKITKGCPRFRHHTSGVKVLPSRFRQYMEEFYGGQFRELSLDDWFQAAQKEGLEELIVIYIRAITERGESLVFPFMGEKAC